MSCTHLAAFLHLHCIHIARMHSFFKSCMLFASSRCWTPAMAASNVGRRSCQRPTLAVWLNLILKCRFGSIRRFPHLCIVFRAFALFFAPLHRFPCLCIISACLHRFPCFRIVFLTRIVFCTRFGLSLACRLHCLVSPAVLFYRLHLH